MDNSVTNGKNGYSVDPVRSKRRCIWNKKIKDTQMEKFKSVVNKKYNVKLESYWDLLKWSIENTDNFWEEIWLFFGIISSSPYEQVMKMNGSLMDVEWFLGAKVNYAENLMRFRDDHTAIISISEDGPVEYVTYAEMYKEVQLYAAALRKNGFKIGDRVACYMANKKEAVFAMLATASIGGVFGGPTPYYGAQAALNIIKQIKPKFLFTVDKMKEDGVKYNLIENLPLISESIEVEKIIIVPTCKETVLKGISNIKNGCFLNEFLDSGKDQDGGVPELIFEQLSFNQPLFINFTSGTTGLPKGLIHATAHILPVLRDYGLNFNFTRQDVIMTTLPVGWSLWNMYTGNLALGATLLLYNGCPYLQSKTYFWDVLSDYKVSHIFMVPSHVDKMENTGISSSPDCDLSHLKVITIGGSPVKHQNVDYLLRNAPDTVLVTSMYGSTEFLGLVGAIDFNEPAFSGEIQVPVLGAELKCIDEDGKDVEQGKLFVGGPNPGLLTNFLAENETLRNSYISELPGYWAQNDEAYLNPETKGFIVLGRCDDTLNVKTGERYGPSVIYYAIHNMEEIADHLCVGQIGKDGSERAILFVKLNDGYEFTKDLVKKIKDKIDSELWYEYVPDVVLEVKAIPYNLNKKRMEILVKKIIATNKIPDVTNIRNPECLQYYCNIPELQGF